MDDDKCLQLTYQWHFLSIYLLKYARVRHKSAENGIDLADWRSYIAHIILTVANGTETNRNPFILSIKERK